MVDMLIKASKEITRISLDKEEINVQNYMESFAYVSTLYNFLNKLKMIIPVKDISFLPTFRGAKTCERFGLDSTEKENEMKSIKIITNLFFEEDTKEELRKRVTEELGPDCELISYDDGIVSFILK
jgi:hypothetical protein